MNRKEIVLVEDDANLRFAFRVVLETAGYRVKLFEDGDGLDAVDPPDLYLLDNQLPGKKTGLTICRELRAKPSTSTTPVIIISGLSTIANEAIKLGATAFIQKPIEFDSFLRLVERVLQPQSTSSASGATERK